MNAGTEYYGTRALRIAINDGCRRQNAVTAVLAHELMPAVEVVESGEVVDNATLRAFFRRHGRATIRSRLVTAFETAATEAVERRVIAELRVSEALERQRPARK